MKIAFDEHVPLAIVRVFQVLASEGFLSGYDFVTARDYHFLKDPKNDDRPWLRRFADDGGRVILSGDRKMRSRLHERAALQEAGFVMVFFGPAWDQYDRFARAAIILRWWPRVEELIGNASNGTFWEIPLGWRIGEIKDVTGPSGEKAIE